jgi:hypothetical protein
MDLGDTINDCPGFDELEELTFDSIQSTPDFVNPSGNNSESDADDGAYTTTFSADELARLR